MMIAKDIKLKDFPFWGGAKAVAERLSDEEFDILENYFEEMLEEDEQIAFNPTYINDFIWFSQELYEIIGTTEEEFWGD